jgi:hypothetical protein
VTSVCRCSVHTRVLRNETAPWVSAGHSANQGATKLYHQQHQRNVYISVTHLLVSHLCDMVPSGAVCVLACCAATANTIMVRCWSLSNQGEQQNLPGSSKE